MESKKRMSVNLIASLVSFATSVFIGMVLTPYISRTLGDGAYGFIGIANNFVSYANIFTIALNSMASRFIAIEIHSNNHKKANIYFNSVIVANLIMAFILAAASGVMIFYLEELLKISEELVSDVKITFTVVFANFILSLLTSIYSIAPFVKNRLDLSSIRNIIGNLIRVVVVIVLFSFLPPKIYYTAISAMSMTVFVTIANVGLSKQLLPEIKVNLKLFRFSVVKELVSSGIWNSINQLSTVLLTGLDLVIANLFISETETGILSIAKMVPTQVTALLATIGGVFTPLFIRIFAQGNVKELVEQVKFSMKVMTLIMTVPLAGFLIFGEKFYSVWLPYKTSEEILKIQILSVLSVLPNVFSAYIYTLYSINTVTNQLKVPVLVTLALSIFSTTIVFVLLKTTSLGIYAIAGVSSIVLILRILFFVPTYASHNLGIHFFTFYPLLIRGIFAFVVLCIFFAFVNVRVQVTNWSELLCLAIGCGVFGYLLNIFLVLNKKERTKLLAVVKRRE